MPFGGRLAIGDASRTARAVGFVIVGVAAFMLKRSYDGPQAVVVASYLGNVSISFAVYFLATIAAARVGLGRLLVVLVSLLVVESFELFSGFGLMSNTYDPWDLLANALGIGLAASIDARLALTSTLGSPD